MTLLELTDEELRAERRRREDGITLAEEAERLSGSLREFLRASWPWIVPTERIDAWHLDVIAEHLEAAYAREIPRLVITIQPGSLKSTLVSVMAPAWWWTRRPSERIVSASHADHLSSRDTRKTRQLILTDWYQSRFGDRFALSLDENLKTRYSNTEGGHRIATHVGGGTGERGGVLILDDAHDASDANSTSEAALSTACGWFGDTWASRLNATVNDPGVKIVIGQRIHERDVIGFLLGGDEDRWVHLCLPTRYEAKHPFVYPERRVLAMGKVLPGDPRKTEGELLAPNFQDEVTLRDLTAEMTEAVKAGQYQQRPAPKEGDLLKRADWKFYDPKLSFYVDFRDGLFDKERAEMLAGKVGSFERVVHSWDTSLKDRKDSDFVAGGVWGTKGPDLFLLRLFHQRVGLSATIEAMNDLYNWAQTLWPSVPHSVVIESAANGPDAIAEMRRRVQGVVAVTAKGSKVMRAEAASAALEGGNCFLPGIRAADGSGYDERTPSDVQRFVEETAKFPNGLNDDEVDQWSQAVNWSRGRRVSSARGFAPVGRA